MSRPKIKHLDLDMAELEAILERTRSGPLSEEEHHRLKAVVTTLAHLTRELEKKRTSITRLRNLLFGPRTEKSGDVLKKPAGTSGTAGKGKKKKRKGHGRNGADAYQGAKKVEGPHGTLKSGDPCPETDCTGKVYPLSDPGLLVRIKGLPPLGATVYELEKLRCNLCGTVFTAKAPPGIGEKKYDETAVSMIGLLKYGAGFPFNRLEKLESLPPRRRGAISGSRCLPRPNGIWSKTPVGSSSRSSMSSSTRRLKARSCTTMIPR
jgi:transposase